MEVSNSLAFTPFLENFLSLKVFKSFFLILCFSAGLQFTLGDSNSIQINLYFCKLLLLCIPVLIRFG